MTSEPPADHPSPPEHPERPLGAETRSAPPPWPAWTAPAALLAGFAAAIVGALVLGLIAAILGADFNKTPASVSILSVVVQDACLIGAALVFARMTAFPRPWHFGLRPAPFWRAVGFTVAGYLIFVVASYVWLQIIGEPDAKDTITEELGAKDSTVALIGVTFVVTVCAPLAEEFFFRGYFYGALRRMGVWRAAALTGLAFGTVHVFGSPIAFIVPLALLGMGLALLREYTGSLYPGIALHCINNSVAMSSSEGWSWQVPVVLVGSLGTIALLIWLALRFWPEPRPTAAAPAAPAPAPAG
ncbi:MAG TPA: type II CAAX endopeptidase family protein [Baekduia sp.]|uniref:CPBP family intramembrane glutamic endopeptidase n=1 Tax=Baekduia sp. TaxID=2600305 RepID=UPI002CCCE83B|nr:type II CAAX endopeptidase family protein [Baekduia sp.]HMJ33833.1 type II CAAX endopeptidase family protein [Baekduia sp.]